MKRKILLFAALLALGVGPIGFAVFAQTNRGPMQLNQDVVDGTVHATATTSAVYSDTRLLGAATVLAADNAGSATNTLINSGLSWPIEGGSNYSLDCDVLYTVGSGGGLTIGVNGPGTPTLVSVTANIATAATTMNYNATSSGTTWAQKVGTATSTVTTIQYAHVTAYVQNPLANGNGTLALQYADVNTTGTTVLKAGTWCSLQ